jgi:hypothetical protein
LGVFVYFIFLVNLYALYEKRMAAMEAVATKKARAPCEKVRAQIIVKVLGKVVDPDYGARKNASFFSVFDANNDNKISMDEFILGVQALGVDLENMTLQDCFRMLDKDQSGFLSPMEFAEFLASGYLPDEQGPRERAPLPPPRDKRGAGHIRATAVAPREMGGSGPDGR